MNISIFSLTESGRLLSLRLSEALGADNRVSRLCHNEYIDEDAASFWNLGSMAGRLYKRSDAMIFICRCDVAVRAVAPYIGNRNTDPVVIVVDDSGKYVIPVLSGHIGAADRLAERVSAAIGAECAVSSGGSGKFSVEGFAEANGLIITDKSAANIVSEAVLNDEKIGFASDYPHSGLPGELTEFGMCRTGIYAGSDTAAKPFDVTLRLVPRNIVLGIGADDDISSETVSAAYNEAIYAMGTDEERISLVLCPGRLSEAECIKALCSRSAALCSCRSEELLENMRSHTGGAPICEKRIGEVTFTVGEKQVFLDFEKQP